MLSIFLRYDILKRCNICRFINWIYLLDRFIILNDWNLFPVPERGWKAQGACFSLFDENMHVKIGKSVGYYGINNLRMVIYYECVSCKLQYHIIRTSPLMNRDKSKDPK